MVSTVHGDIITGRYFPLYFPKPILRRLGDGAVTLDELRPEPAGFDVERDWTGMGVRADDRAGLQGHAPEDERRAGHQRHFA